MFSLNEDQKNTIKSLLGFLKSSEKIFLIHGYAGTGKSTIITYLLQNKYYKDKKIAMTATTNKAVSVLESLTEPSRNISFMTIHRLLKFKRHIDNQGNILYLSSLDKDGWEMQKNTKSIYSYDIIIIDESSMISASMMSNILSVVKHIKGKIILLGDKSQLPPINEEMSKVFNINIPKSELTEIMRNKGSITDFANKIRLIIDDKTIKVRIKDYVNSKFIISKEYEKFYNNYITNFKDNDKPIMLTYTNKQCQNHNNMVRKLLFNTEDKYVEGDLIVFNSYYSKNDNSFYTSQQDIIQKINTCYIQNDVLNFNELINIKNTKVEVSIKSASGTEIMCPICYEESVDFTVQTNCNHYFCSSCINLWLTKNKECPMCRMSLHNSTKDIVIKDDPKLTKMLINIRDSTKDKRLKCYKLTLSEGKDIIVIHEDDEFNHKKLIEYIHGELMQIKKHIEKEYNNNFSKILLNRLWEYFYQNFYDKFANISYGYCITVHKSQGSTFKSVFIDMKDIINKNYQYKAKYQCLYTAITRASESLFIIL